MKQNKTQVLRFKVRKKEEEEEELRRVSVSEKFDGNNENVFPLWPVKFPPFSFLSQFFFSFTTYTNTTTTTTTTRLHTHSMYTMYCVCVCSR